MPPSTTTTIFGTSDTPTKKPTNGHFSKGQWFCNCQPRLPAVQFQVRRDSANKGRWFYTCQIDRRKGKTGQPGGCGFFLWSDDARLREEGAVLNNSTTEPEGGSTDSTGKKKLLRSPRKLVQTTLSARVEPREEGKRHWTHRTAIMPIEDLERAVNGSQTDGSSDDRSLKRLESAQGGGSGRGTATSNTSDGKTFASTSTHTLDHDYNASDMDTDDEDELSRIADSVSKPADATSFSRQAQLQTPSAGSKRKRDVVDVDASDDDLFGRLDSDEERQLAAITDSSSQPSRNRTAFTTPAAKRSTDVVDGMPTPSRTDKSVRRVLFAEPAGGESSNNKRQRNDHTGGYASIGESTTPSSSQEIAGISSSPTTPGSGFGNITEEVMGLLNGQKIDEQVLRQVKTTLQKYAAKAKGLEKGRDVSRQLVKTQEGKVAQLQMRIADLENKRKLDLEAKKKIKSQLMHLYTEH